MQSQNIASLSFRSLGMEYPMRHPDQEGPAGRAWLLSPTARPEHAASLGSWLVNVPDAHPWWQWWVVGVVHLRDVAGVAEAKRSYPEAEYEFTILTIDPEESPTPDPDLVNDGYSFLYPADVAEQFDSVSDGDAARIAHIGIQAIVSGRISPDEDFRPAWRKMLDETVKSFHAGLHALN